MKNGETMTLKAKGLPFFERSAGRGNIFIKFTVEYPRPSEITPEMESKLDEVRVSLTIRLFLGKEILLLLKEGVIQ